MQVPPVVCDIIFLHFCSDLDEANAIADLGLVNIIGHPTIKALVYLKRRMYMIVLDCKMSQIQGITCKEALAGLASLRSEGLLCDVELEVEGRRIPAHRALLAGLSPYFKALFTGNFKEANEKVVTLHQISAEGLIEIIDCFYSPGLTLTNENLPGILAAANLLEMTSIVSQCQQFMKDEMCETTCLPFLKLAEQYELGDIQIQADKFVISNFLNVCHRSDFMEISKDALVQYISSDELNRGLDESKVFDAVKEWLSFEQGRMQFAEEILDHVRFMTISLDKLNEFANTDSVAERCRAHVHSALTYHGNEFKKPLYNELQNKPRGKEGIMTIQNHPSLRSWKTIGETLSTIHFSGHSANYSLLDVKFINHSACAVQLNNFLFVFAVDNDTFQPVTMRYEAATAKWLKLAPVPSQATAHSTAARLGHDIYLLSGCVLSKTTTFPIVRTNFLPANAFQYRIASNKWVKLPDIRRPAISSASSASERHGCVYISGGWGRKMRATTAFYAYDKEANLWLSKPRLNRARADHLMEVCNDKVYVFAGCFFRFETSSFVKETEMYDITSEQWTVLGGSDLSVCESFSLVKDEKIFIIGGMIPSRSSSRESTQAIQKFDTNTQQFITSCQELSTYSRDHVCGMFIFPQLR